MTFQTQVQSQFTQGWLGELIKDGPLRALPARIAVDVLITDTNTFGKAFTFVADAPSVGASGQTVRVGGAGAFAGILVDPKDHALYGTAAGGSLAPTMDLPQGEAAQFCTMGYVVVSMSTSTAFGDPVYFAPATTGGDIAGALYNTAGRGRTLITGAKVLTTKTGAGLCVIQLG